MRIRAIPRRSTECYNFRMSPLPTVGRVPAERIFVHPTPGTATIQDAIRFLNDSGRRACELIDGTLVEKAGSLRESRLAMRLVGYVAKYLDRNDFGFLTGERGAFQLREGRIRIPDAAFFTYASLPNGEFPNDPIPMLIPELVVEVLSESNTTKEMELKRRDYFPAGVRIVWEIDCDERSVEVFTSPDESTTLTLDDTLDGGAVLPGFTLPLRELFTKLDRED